MCLVQCIHVNAASTATTTEILWDKRDISSDPLAANDKHHFIYLIIMALQHTVYNPTTYLHYYELYKTVYIVTAKIKTNAGRKLKLTKCALWQQCNPNHTAPAGAMLAKLGINIITCSLATGMTEMISNTIIYYSYMYTGTPRHWTKMEW